MPLFRSQCLRNAFDLPQSKCELFLVRFECQPWSAYVSLAAFEMSFEIRSGRSLCIADAGAEPAQ